MEEATRVLMNFFSHYRGTRVSVYCRNGHQIYGLVHTVSYRSWAVGLSRATVRRGEHFPEIHNDFMVINAFGILSVVFPPLLALDPDRANQRFEYAEIVYRQMMAPHAEEAAEEAAEEEEDPPERAVIPADEAPAARTSPIDDSGQPPKTSPRRD